MVLSLEELYEKYTILSNAKDKIEEHAQDYHDCIKATKGGAKEKQLAAQIIQKFFKHFPAYQDEALNAVLDLCEEENQICIYAMKVLPFICKDSKEHLTNIASVLAQLLQLQDQGYTTACNCLIQVFRQDEINTVRGIFGIIHNPSEDVVREKCVMFVFKKLIKLQDKLSTELEDFLIQEAKKIIQDSSANEFLTVMPFLTSSKLVKTKAGQQELVDLVGERVEIDRDFDPLEEGNTDRIIMCVDCILSLFNANIESTKFVKYYCDQILPQWDVIGKLEGGEGYQYQLLKQLAELSAHCGTLENPSLHVVQIFDKMKHYMPPPPENADMADMPNLDFTTVECLLYSFHRLARQCPDFLTADEQVLKDFRLRLQYFQRGVQGCRRSLDKTLADKPQLNSEDQEKVKIAPAVLDNINILIRDLFYQTPLYKCNVQLSFKGLSKVKTSPSEATSPGQKRHKPITFDSSNGSTTTKQTKSTRGADNVKLYTVPTGKYSNNFNNRTSPRGGRGRGGNRGQRSRGIGRRF